jgi:hypothetical protein
MGALGAGKSRSVPSGRLILIAFVFRGAKGAADPDGAKDCAAGWGTKGAGDVCPAGRPGVPGMDDAEEEDTMKLGGRPLGAGETEPLVGS